MAKKRKKKKSKSKRSPHSPEHLRNMAKWRIAGLLANAEQVQDSFGKHLHALEMQNFRTAVIYLRHTIRSWGN
tara:strand:+ start:9316 stop:9534 length:219 start_codon:yes stop_codon:yes gene_type:complete